MISPNKNIEYFSRLDKSIFGRWWWTVDKVTMLAVFILIIIGLFSCFSSSPAVATKLKLPPFFFAIRHSIMSLVCIFVIFSVSLLETKHLRFICLVFYVFFVPLLILTLFIGAEIKGSKRWLNFLGFSLQPSEFLKPIFAIVSAWCFSQRERNSLFPGIKVSMFLLAGILIPLAMQPDVGMSLLFLATWLSQIFVFGISWMFVIVMCLSLVSVMIVSYFVFPHVHKRIDQFLNIKIQDSFGEFYQVKKSIEAFSHGGFFGVGPGEGTIKHHLPDSHSDFVFSVIGEELGMVFCLFLLVLFFFIFARFIFRALEGSSCFILLSVVGICFQFSFQTIINISSSLNLIPTKGMTLPFLSYGGSSSIAISFAIGILLSLTRKRCDIVENI